MEAVKIDFFKINRCGYYRIGHTAPEFCPTPEMLLQLQGWSQGKVLALTQTYHSTPDLLRAFLYDIQESDGDWLLTLWNETPSNSGTVPSIRPNDAVGHAPVHFNELLPGSVPGFASYFWFIGGENIFANIRFSQMLGGHAQLRKYLTGYLERSTSHVVFAEDEDAQEEGFDLKVTGYRRNDGEAPMHLNPMFKSAAYLKPGRINMLRERVQDITRVHRRITLDMATQEDLDFWQRLRRRMSRTHPDAPADQTSVAYSMKTLVSAPELESMIQTAEQDPDNTWDDIGFDLRGDHSTHWLSKSYARDTIQLEVDRQDQEIVNGSPLLRQLQRHKDHLMRVLQEAP